MPRHVKKSELPTKLCVTCQRPFTWRKKWSRCWDQVRYCSQRCRGERPAGVASGPDASASGPDQPEAC